MENRILKYIFFIFSASLLILMLLMSRNAGISCDEVLHYEHSVAVCDFFSTHGKDTSALHTPETNLKYYGQSYDNITTMLIRWLDIDDVYKFRHLMSAAAGWAAVMITALFAVWLSGYGTAVLVLLLFAVSPVFLGHSMNNLKDIPFALSYIAGIFFSLRIVRPDNDGYSPLNVFLLIMAIAFAISLRAGGLILICYLFLFFFLAELYKYFNRKIFSISGVLWKLILLVLISFAAFFLGILLWPYALHGPFRNVAESYHIMAHYPLTFRQLFEGTAQWSDLMPWYFIPKSMLITIPLIVLTGFFTFFIFAGRIYRSGKLFVTGLTLVTLLFPLVFVIIIKSNVYSSWRQFLFLYPVIVLLSATGLNCLFVVVKNRLLRIAIISAIIITSVHPALYMIRNHPYEYIYFNQLVGGLKGAYGDYETDYYYTAQTEASAWLIDYLKNNNIDSAVIKATFSVEWPFRDYPEYRTSYLRFEDRSMHNWDYAIITNRYIPPIHFKNGRWPSSASIFNIYADSVPVCTVLKRRTKADYLGYQALISKKYDKAVKYFEEAVKINDEDEMIFYNFARALNETGQSVKADSLLAVALEINPGFEPVLMYSGDIAVERDERESALDYYEKLIKVNMKQYEAYIKLARLLEENDRMEARRLLRACLRINPGYRPAIIALGDTYRDTNIEIAKKYYRLADTINN